MSSVAPSYYNSLYPAFGEPVFEEPQVLVALVDLVDEDTDSFVEHMAPPHAEACIEIEVINNRGVRSTAAGKLIHQEVANLMK